MGPVARQWRAIRPPSVRVIATTLPGMRATDAPCRRRRGATMNRIRTVIAAAGARWD